MDISGRKRAEYLTGHVFETSPDAIYIVGRDYRYQRVNAAFERRWRMPAERIVGMRVDDLVGTQPFEETYKPSLDRCFAGEEVSFGGWFPTPAGRKYLAATYSPRISCGPNPNPGADGKFYTYFNSPADLTIPERRASAMCYIDPNNIAAKIFRMEYPSKTKPSVRGLACPKSSSQMNAMYSARAG